MNFIDYCVYTKNFAAITAVKDFIKETPTPIDAMNLLRDEDKLEKEEKKRRDKLANKLSIASSLATMGYVGTRLGNYFWKKYHNEDPNVDEDLLDIGDE